MSDVTIARPAIENRWAEIARPTTPEGWLERAQEVSDILAADAVERDAANQPPHAEVALLKDSSRFSARTSMAVVGRRGRPHTK